MLYQISEKVRKLQKDGREIVNFIIGDPDIQTPYEIVKAASEAMKKGMTKYSFAAGETRLREKLASNHKVSTENVVITPGSKWAIFSIMYLLLKNGGNVVIPTPYWTAYALIANSIGAETRFLRTEINSEWNIDTEQLENLVDRKTRLLILNNPNNPTSKSVKDEVIEEIVQFADEKKITILSDETYSDISFVKTKNISDFDTEHVLVNSFSKTFAISNL